MQRRSVRAAHPRQACQHIVLSSPPSSTPEEKLRHHTVHGRPVNGARSQRGVQRVDAAAAPSQSLLLYGALDTVADSEGGDDGKGCVSGSRRHGLPMAGHLKAKGGHELTVYTGRRPSPRNGSPSTAAKARRPRKRRPTARTLSCAASAMTTTCARSRSGQAGHSPAWRKARYSSTTPPPRPRSRASSLPRDRSAASTASTRRSPGGQAGAENGVLTVMCGGEAAAYARAEPVIAAYARMCKLLGAPGAGQLTKMVNQICIAGLVQGPGRGHPLRQEGRPRRRGGDPDHLQGCGAVLADGEPLQDHERRQVRLRLRSRLDAQGHVDLPRRGAQRTAPTCRSPRWSISFYAEVQKMGGKRWDTSSLLARLER